MYWYTGYTHTHTHTEIVARAARTGGKRKRPGWPDNPPYYCVYAIYRLGAHGRMYTRKIYSSIRMNLNWNKTLPIRTLEKHNARHCLCRVKVRSTRGGDTSNNLLSGW